VLQHTEPQKHIPIGASDLDLAATPGYNRIPQNLAQEVIWWSQSGIRARDCLRLLNAKAEYLLNTKAEYLPIKKPFPWTYDTVYNLVRCDTYVKELQRKRKTAATAEEVDDEGDGEEAGKVHDGIVGNPHTKAKGAGRPKKIRIRNTGHGAGGRRKGSDKL